MKLVGYLRVSTDGQADDGYGLEVQRAAIDNWARGRGDRIVRWCSDEGVSGTVEAVDREGLSCVLVAIELRQAEGVVVARLDRLARKLHVQEAALAHIWRAGGSAFTADGGEVLQDDPEDPMRTAMRQMIGVFAELERSMIVKRMRDGRRMKAQKGGYAYGSPPLGYRSEHGSLTIDEGEQAIVNRIADLRQSGASLRSIATTLNEEGLLPKRGKATGSQWHPETLRRVIARLDTPRAAERETTR